MEATVRGHGASVRVTERGYLAFKPGFSELLRHARAAATDGQFDILALSGGGSSGAFGVGAVVGMTRNKTRPVFEVVTGVSTGSLIAPFAFLGSDWDEQLVEAYTGGHTDNLLASGGIASLFRVGVYDNQSLRNLVDRFVTDDLVRAVARESAKGRALFVATTNLDTEQPVFWNLGAIAQEGGEAARKLFVDILVASSSIPGAFPPVMVPVSGPSGEFEEMHVDGGVTVPFFLAPEVAFITHDIFEEMHGANLYVIIDGQIATYPKPTSVNTVSMVLRSMNVAMMRRARADLLLTYAFARRNDMTFRFTYLPSTYDWAGSLAFDRKSMRSLFEYAAACSAAGKLWLTAADILKRNDAAPPALSSACPAAEQS